MNLGYGNVDPMAMQNWTGNMQTANMGAVPMAGTAQPQSVSGFSMGQTAGANLAMPNPVAAMTPQALTMPSGTDIAGVGVQAPQAPIATTPVAPADAVSNGNMFKNSDGTFNFDGLGTITDGLATIGSLWSSWQQTKLAKETLAFNKASYQENLANEKQSYNTTLQGRTQAEFMAEGRSMDEVDAYYNENKL
jgi:hypothetical protein